MAGDLISMGPPGFMTLKKDHFFPSTSLLYLLTPQMGTRCVAPVCKICACLESLLIYLYPPVKRYLKFWEPGEPAHLKELYQRDAHVLKSNALKSGLSPLLTFLLASERSGQGW